MGSHRSGHYDALSQAVIKDTAPGGAYLGETQSQTRNHLHYSACGLPANFNSKWILLDDDIIETAIRGAGWGTGDVQRNWDFIPTVAGIIDLGQMK